MSTSELTRLLNIPDSQMTKAIQEKIVCPLGKIGCSMIIALTDDELDELRRRFAPAAAPGEANHPIA